MEIIYKIRDNSSVLSWLRFDYEHDRKRSQNRQYRLKYFKNKKPITTEISIKTENMLL